MTWLAIRLFMGKALERLLSAFRWMIAHPREALLIVAAAALFWQNRAIHSARVERDNIAAAFKAHLADDKRIAAQTKAQSNTTAKEGDNVHTIIKTVYRDASARFIATNRLPPSASPAAEGNPASVPTPAPAETVMVIVPASDINTCSDAYAYALSAFLWGQAKVKDGRAEYRDDLP